MTSKHIEELASQIRRHRDLYYNQSPELSDAEFDELEDQLRRLDPEHPVLAEVGANTRTLATLRLAPGGQAQDADWMQSMCDRYYLDDLKISKQDEINYAYSYAIIYDVDPLAQALKFLVPPAGEWGRDWPKQDHNRAMGSLNKVNEATELHDWIQRCEELAAKSELPPMTNDLAVTEKLDGISLALLYINGQLDRAITRGNGVTGERITANVMRIKGVPHKIEMRGEVSIRGEVILKKSDAEEFIERRLAIDPDFQSQNLRNSAAGVARARHRDMITGCESLSLIAYDIQSTDNFPSESSKTQRLQELGFETPFFFVCDVEAAVACHAEYEKEKRAKLDYDIDGLVVRANDVETQIALGDLNNRPRAAVAFKFGNEKGITKLINIDWQTGDTGRITPVAEVEPIRLAGAVISKASLHNIENMKQLGIAVGDEVSLSRRNDVIPYIEEVTKKGPNTLESPTQCNQCGEAVQFENKYIYCRNLSCPAIRQGRLKTWINTLDFQGWGEERLKLVFEHGLAREPSDLYLITVEKLKNLRSPPLIRDGKKMKGRILGEKSASLMLEGLLALREIPLATFIAALGIESVSKETAKLLVAAGYKSIDAILETDLESLASIHRLGEIKAKSILDGLRTRRDEIERLATQGVVPITPSDKSGAKAGALLGMSFCFSGSHSRPRKQLQDLVEENGGEIRAGVTKGLSYLVLADANSTSSKAVKARKLGTKVIDEAVLAGFFNAKLDSKPASVRTRKVLRFQAASTHRFR